MKRLRIFGWCAWLSLLGGCASGPAASLRPIDNPRPTFGAEVFAPSMLTVQPVARRRVPPVYPAALRAASINGQAIVVFVVRPDGTVSDASVLRADDLRFGDAAAAAVSRWQFNPGEINGEPVACWMALPVVFRIHDS